MSSVTAIIAAITSVANVAGTIVQSSTQLMLEGIVRPKAAEKLAYQDRLRNSYLPAAIPTTTPPPSDTTGKYILYAAIAVFGLVLTVKLLKNE